MKEEYITPENLKKWLKEVIEAFRKLNINPVGLVSGLATEIEQRSVQKRLEMLEEMPAFGAVYENRLGDVPEELSEVEHKLTALSILRKNLSPEEYDIIETSYMKYVENAAKKPDSKLTKKHYEFMCNFQKDIYLEEAATIFKKCVAILDITREPLANKNPYLEANENLNAEELFDEVMKAYVGDQASNKKLKESELKTLGQLKADLLTNYKRYEKNKSNAERS